MYLSHSELPSLLWAHLWYSRNRVQQCWFWLVFGNRTSTGAVLSSKSDMREEKGGRDSQHGCSSVADDGIVVISGKKGERRGERGRRVCMGLGAGVEGGGWARRQDSLCWRSRQQAAQRSTALLRLGRRGRKAKDEGEGRSQEGEEEGGKRRWSSEE